MKDQVNKNYKNEIDIVYYSGFVYYKREMILPWKSRRL